MGIKDLKCRYIGIKNTQVTCVDTKKRHKKNCKDQALVKFVKPKPLELKRCQR